MAGVPVILNRISFSGELGFELYCRPEYLLRLSEAIETTGADLEFRWYGARALMSMRLEKGWGVWTLEFRPDFNAIQSRMDVFINWDKEFVGKEASLVFRQNEPDRKLVTMTIDVQGIDVSNDEAILKAGVAIGCVSSGGYGHRVGKSMAMGYVLTKHAVEGAIVQVEILGEVYDAEILGVPAYDPTGAQMRLA